MAGVCPSGSLRDDIPSTSTFTLFVGTWNVNGQSPEGGLDNWLEVHMEAPDLYVLGFQELDLSWWAFLFQESVKEDEWIKAVKESLPAKASYLMVKKIRLVGMMLLVFSKEDHVDVLHQVSVGSVGTGIQGIFHKWGNKGGVAISLKIHDTNLCFVNCHLAAGEIEVERRNQDYYLINEGISFNIDNTTKPQLLSDSEIIIWMGDLNYRLNLKCDTIKNILSEGNLSKLRGKDQLNQQRKLGKVFKGFQEGIIMFRPTYKYDIGTSRWDSSRKVRSPAWTDRILWRGESITQSAYRSHEDMLISDHKPVSAIFQIPVKITRETNEDVNNNDYHRDAFQVTNHNMPLDFGLEGLHQIAFGACVCLMSAYISYQVKLHFEEEMA